MLIYILRRGKAPFLTNIEKKVVSSALSAVLRSTAPAPLGVRKVHKIVYNIASIFNFGLALRALAAVLPSYYTRGRGVGVDLVVGYYPGVVLGVWG